MGSAEICVRWRNHSGALSSACKNFLEDNYLVDCTVSAEGQCLNVHRLILSACSPYFQLMFKQDNEKHPIIFLRDTKFVELKALIDFIYHGEAQIPEDCLRAFFQLAESLQIKGLNDTSQSNVNKITEEFVRRNFNPSLSSDCFSESSAVDAQANFSSYRNRECDDKETNVVQLSSNSKNSLKRQPSYPLDVCTKLVKPNTSLPSGEYSDLNYKQVNSPLVTPQQPSSSPVEMPPCVKDAVKSERDEIEILEPKFEEIYVKMDTANADDYPENYTEHEEITSGYQMENANNQSQGHPAFEHVEPATSWHQQFPAQGVADSIHPFDNLSCPQPSEAPTRLEIMDKKLKNLNLKEKISVIKMVSEEKKTIKEVMSHFKCGKTQIYIMKQKDKIMEKYLLSSKNDLTRMKERYTKYSELNRIVFEWFTAARAKNFPISGPILQEKAKETAGILNLGNFSASNGWLQSFRKRHCITFNISCGEAEDVDKVTVEN